jgi:predicted transcriptional regulator
VDSLSADSVTTGVDALLQLLKERKKISLSEAAKELKLKESAIKQWVDFLVEEKIIGIEYKFTKAYLYLNETEEEKEDDKKSESLQVFKDEFKKRAQESNIDPTQVELLWERHLLSEIELQKNYFFQEAKNKEIPQSEIVWENYKEKTILRGRSE